jgi:hypothetical protein
MAWGCGLKQEPCHASKGLRWNSMQGKQSFSIAIMILASRISVASNTSVPSSSVSMLKTQRPKLQRPPSETKYPGSLTMPFQYMVMIYQEKWRPKKLREGMHFISKKNFKGEVHPPLSHSVPVSCLPYLSSICFFFQSNFKCGHKDFYITRILLASAPSR